LDASLWDKIEDKIADSFNSLLDSQCFSAMRHCFDVGFIDGQSYQLFLNVEVRFILLVAGE
jgi:hypothetical protein